MTLYVTAGFDGFERDFDIEFDCDSLIVCDEASIEGIVTQHVTNEMGGCSWWEYR